jgi:hypothetical protein
VRALALAAAVGMAGCVAPGAPPPGVETVRAERKAGVMAPLARGETQLVVRAVAAGAPAGQELQGARCVADAAYFRAEFASPARVLLPDFGAESPAVTVTCRSGTASGSAVAAPQAAWQGGLGGWPAVGVSVGTGNSSGVGVGLGWWGGGGVGAAGGTPVVRYPEVRVVVG